MNLILLIILLLLMINVSGKKGIKLFFSLVINFILLVVTFVLIALKVNPIIVTLISSFIICYIVIYMVNGEGEKSRSAIISIFIVLICLIPFIFIMTLLAKTCGFGYESFEEINMFSYNINLNMLYVEVSLILIGLIGAIIDSSVSISSALYEIFDNNNKLSEKELFRSGLNIGKDILGTTVNTLLFAFIGEELTLIFWLFGDNSSFLELINNKTLIAETIKIVFSGMGCLLVIPLTSFITSKRLVNSKNVY